MPRAIPDLDELDHADGPRDAALELVVYGDFQCPYCAAAQSMLHRVRERLDGRLRFAFRHLPLDAHPQAQAAAETAEAASAQDAFWPMHDRLFAARGRLLDADLAEHATALGLDVGRVQRELGDGTHAARVARDADSAVAAGVRATPAFFVNGALHSGSFDVRSLIDALEAT